ncbi:hypothetical protein SAMN00808754_1388 [Thermanaeromonas toyohensis ToBE]|uniref:Uncharacterized protein n=1 Tax=Thermanaeromonas toyohensis ToBE TaxID=698762 RepID=A0A1W1VS01_9FIRM|nr:hypothetical protein [Thermanaeromonas toyohensis]SMB96043.1 hypothetical protein SAMN00808754_1388 [Thermanaeromonas toyohensis ToBE]
MTKAVEGARWEWDCGDPVLLVDRNVARDVKLTRVPPKGNVVGATAMHTGEEVDAIAWKWPDDGRVFLVPRELLRQLKPTMPLVRDVIVAAGHLYRTSGYPENRVIETSYRQLAQTLALSWTGKLVADKEKVIGPLEMALTLARWLTIKGQPVIRRVDQHGRIEEISYETFGFIDRVSRIAVRNGRELPVNKQPLEIELSAMYTLMLEMLPAVPFPVKALEAAHRAPRRLRTATKNLAYYLAGRVPLEKITLAVSTLADITGFRNSHRTELRRSVERVVGILNPIMIRDYYVEGDVYVFELAGRLCTKSDGR